MELYWIGLGLFFYAFVRSPLHPGPLYWFSFALLSYVFTYPNGPADSIHRRLSERRHQPKTTCTRCRSAINAQDNLCAPCKLEISLGMRGPSG